MDPLTKEIATDAALLVQKTAGLVEQVGRIPALEKQAADSAKQAQDSAALAGRLAKESADMRAKVRGEIEKVAARFVERGSLDKEKVAAFVQMIEDDPSQVVAVMEKIATEATAQQLGVGGGEDAAAGALDPIELFASQ